MGILLSLECTGVAHRLLGSSALSEPEAIERARKRNPNAFKPWTRQEDRRLREGVASGSTPEELASELQRSPRAASMRLEKIGVRPAG